MENGAEEPSSKRPRADRKVSVNDTESNSRIIISASSKGKSNICSVISRVVAECGCRIVDIKQFAVQNAYTLAMIVEISGSHQKDSSHVVKELLFKAKEAGIDVEFKVSSGSDVPEPSPKARIKNYVITVISQQISPAFLADLTEVLAARKVNVEKIETLSEGVTAVSTPFSTALQCIEFSMTFDRSMGVTELKKELLQLSKRYGVDVALQPETLFRRSKRLIVMDMDSTLIQQEVIEELARHAGVFEKVQDITHRAMNGELDFNQSLFARCGLLKGISVDVFKHVIANLKYTEGAHFLASALKQLGYKLAVISGGFTPVTEHVKSVLGLDYAFANTLEVDPETQTLTGNTVGPIVNAQRKADLLRFIAQKEGITLDQVVAVGDGANDLLMLAAAGLGIAFCAKPKVQEAAQYRLNQKNLDAILFLLGINEREARFLTEDAKGRRVSL